MTRRPRLPRFSPSLVPGAALALLGLVASPPAPALEISLPEARERVKETARDLYDRSRVAGIELRRRMRRAERLGRDNAFLMALAALGIGILVGWAIGRDRE